jgi:hydroxymethylpyrimidine pyrophosphatase-like HAD family hydrolase
MDLIFFDLDGTLLNDASVISPFTKETLGLLKDKNIAYTVATGRTMLSARTILKGHDFDLPQIYTNGVTIWDPLNSALTLENLLTNNEIATVIDAALSQGITPFVHAIDTSNHFIYHATPQHTVEENLISKHYSGTEAKLFPLDALPADSQVTNISMIGSAADITDIWRKVDNHPNLVTYSGPFANRSMLIRYQKPKR